MTDRRRAEEDVAKARKFAVEGFAESLLPVKDSLEAAIAIPNATTEQVLEAALRSGRLCMSAVGELARVLTPENEAEVLPRFLGCSAREAREAR